MVAAVDAAAVAAKGRGSGAVVLALSLTNISDVTSVHSLEGANMKARDAKTSTQATSNQRLCSQAACPYHTGDLKPS